MNCNFTFRVLPVNNPVNFSVRNVSKCLCVYYLSWISLRFTDQIVNYKTDNRRMGQRTMKYNNKKYTMLLNINLAGKKWL